MTTYTLPNGKKVTSPRPLTEAELMVVVREVGMERTPPPPVESPMNQAPQVPGWLNTLTAPEQMAWEHLPNVTRIATGFGGPLLSGAGELGASALEYLRGEDKSLLPQSIGDRGVLANTLEAMALPKAMEWGVQGIRALPALGRRVLPWMHTAAEAERKGAYDVAEAAARRTFREEEIARKADFSEMKLATGREAAERIAQERELMARADLAKRERIKQELQGIGTPTGKSEAMYAAADVAAKGQRLTSMPHTDQVVSELSSTLMEGHPLRPILVSLNEGTGLDLPQALQMLRDVGRVHRPEARRLYEALATDMGAHPEGKLFRDAAGAFKEDVGREMVGNLVGKSGPLAKPLDPDVAARTFERGREGLASRLPDTELARVEALIREAQTPLPPPQLPPVVGNPVQGPMQPEVFTRRVFQPPPPFQPQPLEGPLASPYSISALLGGGVGGYFSGNPYVQAGTAALAGGQMIPPMVRAMGEVGSNPDWLDALIGAIGSSGRVAVDEFTGPVPELQFYDE